LLVNAGIFMIAEIKKHIPYVERETRIVIFDGLTGDMTWKTTAEIVLSEAWSAHLQSAELHMRHLLMNPPTSDADWEKGWDYFKLQVEQIRGAQKNFAAGHPVLSPLGWVQKINPTSEGTAKSEEDAKPSTSQMPESSDHKEKGSH
jgi:hypothetical protein